MQTELYIYDVRAEVKTLLGLHLFCLISVYSYFKC
jgi:hypothetical protein